MNRMAGLASGLAAVALLAACSDPEPGAPVPAVTSSSVSTSDSSPLPRNGAPKVQSPLDISHFLRQPCDVLTEADIQVLFGTSASPKPDVDAPTGPDCAWHKSGSQGTIAVVIPQLDESGLSSLYANRDNLPLFEEMEPIGGYPVVAYSTDGRHDDECTLRIGTSDRETMNISLVIGESKVGQLDPCQAAHDQVATAVIRNIKARQ